MNDMKYWINRDGKQLGPMSFSELMAMSPRPTEWVWHEGMPDWLQASQIPEVAEQLAVEGIPIEQVTPQRNEPDEAYMPRAVADNAATDNATATPSGESATATAQPMPAIPPIHAQAPAPTPAPAVTGTPIPQPVQQPQQAGQLQQGTTQEPMPPTNLVWAIVVTVLCCVPLGIVAIYQAMRVNSAYGMGDIVAAKRHSEAGAWWCIAGIIAGITIQPFISLIQMAILDFPF